MIETRTRFADLTLIALAVIAFGTASCSKPADQSQTTPATTAAADTIATAEHGAYLATIMGCHDCHTPGTFYNAPDFQRALSGSELGWTGPWGTSYPRNLTPDPETGIGAWSEDDIVHALQTGMRPDGRVLRAPMPWPLYAHLTRKDVHSIAKYLKSLVPVSHRVPDVLPPGKKAPSAFVLPAPPAWDAPRTAAAPAPTP